MITIPKSVYIVLIIIIHLFSFVFISINLFSTEYNDPPYNYLSKNWLNSPIKNIELKNPSENTKISEYDNQQNLGFFNSGSKKHDLNIFKGKFYKIERYTPYYYPNFVGFFHKKENNKLCGKDSQGNLLYFPKDKECPLNLIVISNDNEYCSSLNIQCNYQQLNDGKYLVTSNKNINGEIITQLRINYNNEICADSSVDLTFNEFLSDYKKMECKEEYGYDKIYKKIGEENIQSFLNENNLNNINIKKNDNIFLSYRGYLGVDNIDKFSEHPIDHVTYAKRIALSKNIILFIFWFYCIFYSIFIFLFYDKKKFICFIKILSIIYLIIFIFDFSYDFHVIFTYIRVKGIISTVNLDGLFKYKTGLRWFIVIDIFILCGVAFDFALKLLQYLEFKALNQISEDKTKAISMATSQE